MRKAAAVPSRESGIFWGNQGGVGDPTEDRGIGGGGGGPFKAGSIQIRLWWAGPMRQLMP